MRIMHCKCLSLHKSTEQIKADHPEIPAFEEFDDLLAAIKAAL